MKDLPLCCPCDKKELLRISAGYVCSNENCAHSRIENAFPVVNEIPVLISEIQTDTVFSIENRKTYVDRSMSKYNNLRKIIVGESRVTKDNCALFIELMLEVTEKPRILVVGGGEKGAGTEKLWSSRDLEIHSFDIYASNTTDFVSDAHYMPLESGSYDGVWIQAVLEHVVEPNKVVSEINRVLKQNGFVYAETPFMQQVHEGAYDFTRYTVLGHRYLFKNFQLIDMGGVHGPDVALAWSLRYFIWALSRSRKFARMCGLIFGLILRPFSKLISKKSLYDASSGVYFLGRKQKDHYMTHKELVSLYKGNF